MAKSRGPGTIKLDFKNPIRYGDTVRLTKSTDIALRIAMRLAVADEEAPAPTTREVARHRRRAVHARSQGRQPPPASGGSSRPAGAAAADSPSHPPGAGGR
ncbi:hypothetical protein GCM10020000_15750 [Streptomyces olivoverticillatus]